MSRTAWFAIALTASTFAARAQTTIVANTSVSFADRWPTSFADRWGGSLPEPARTAPVAQPQLASVDTRPVILPAVKQAERATYGLASFYWQGQRTASGEKFDKRELTAAHRTLPFGTRVLVTNLATGRSVTVRVNDRGPFIAGRIIDVSRAAAEELGMVGRGVTKVKLTVVQ
jgi:rare lipoprotein A